MPYSISRAYSFCAAHRIEGHPKCGRLHGHNYEVIVEYAHPAIPQDGMLIDYGELDKIVKPIIGRMDHRYILSSSNILMNDPYRKVAFERGDVFELPTAASTAELLAEFLWNEVFQALRLDYPVYPQNLRIIVKETPKSSAAYQGEVPK